MGFYEGKKALVAGGAGFIGSHVVEALLNEGADVSVVTRNSGSVRVRHNLGGTARKVRMTEGDLRNPKDCTKAVKGQQIVINLASSIGNIEFNKAHADILHDNVTIELNMLDAAAKAGAERYLVMSSAFVYPADIGRPVREGDADSGAPSDTKFGYAWSKKTAEAAAKAYLMQYGLKSAIIRPSNVYGPRDNFGTGRGLVIPSFIERVCSGGKELVVAGDGMQVRNFVYVEDCVAGMLACLEKHAVADPVNIAAEDSTSIRSIAEHVVRLSGKKINVRFDEGLPAGPRVVSLEITKARELLGFVPKVALEDGLERTFRWFEANR